LTFTRASGWYFRASAVWIELFTARLLYRVSYREIEYSTDTESSYYI